MPTIAFFYGIAIQMFYTITIRHIFTRVMGVQER